MEAACTLELLFPSSNAIKKVLVENKISLIPFSKGGIRNGSSKHTVILKGSPKGGTIEDYIRF